VIADVEQTVGRIARRGVRPLGQISRIGVGTTVEHAHDAFDDVVDVGEIALHVAVVVNVDRPTFEDGLGE